jgi:hypothetical protein
VVRYFWQSPALLFMGELWYLIFFVSLSGKFSWLAVVLEYAVVAL